MNPTLNWMVQRMRTDLNVNQMLQRSGDRVRRKCAQRPRKQKVRVEC